MTERLQYEEETEGGKNGEVDAEVEEGEETKVEKEEVRVQSARPVVAAGVVDPAAACLQQASTGRIRLPSRFPYIVSFGTL